MVCLVATASTTTTRYAYHSYAYDRVEIETFGQKILGDPHGTHPANTGANSVITILSEGVLALADQINHTTTYLSP